MTPTPEAIEHFQKIIDDLESGKIKTISLTGLTKTEIHDLLFKPKNQPLEGSLPDEA